MELCYEGSLAMPSNCVNVTNEEMEYIEGGWSWSTLGKSLKNLYYSYRNVAAAMRCGGITLSVIAQVTSGAATYLYWTIAGMLGSVAAANFVVGLVVGFTATAAIWTMGTWVCF